MCGRDNLLGRGASFYKIQSLVSFSSSHLNKFKFKLTIQGNGLKSNEVKSTQKEDFVWRDNLLGGNGLKSNQIKLTIRGNSLQWFEGKLHVYDFFSQLLSQFFEKIKLTIGCNGSKGHLSNCMFASHTGKLTHLNTQ